MISIAIGLAVMLGLLLLAGCTNGNNGNGETTTAPETPRGHTIEELGETIVAAGTFWEDWWNFRGPFDWQHFAPIETFDEPLPEHYVTGSDEHNAWLERQRVWHEEYLARFPEHLRERGFFWVQLLPSSGFESLSNIRDYLLQYYTERWVDAELFGEFTKFVEYDGVLYVCGARAGLSRANWETAEHELIEQDGSRAVVETTVMHGAWHREPYEEDIGAVPVQYRFTFVDGRIDQVESPFGAE